MWRMPRQVIPAGALVAVLGVLPGCSPTRLSETIHRMGEVTTLGPVSYNVLQTDWRNQLGDGIDQRIPSNRFLLITLAVTNSAPRPISVPLLSLEDKEGNSFRELSEVRGVANWLGLLRNVNPSSGLEGVIVFDVPPSDYRLRVTDCADIEEERTALIEIPLSLGGAQSPSPPA